MYQTEFQPKFVLVFIVGNEAIGRAHATITQLDMRKCPHRISFGHSTVGLRLVRP